MAAFTSIAAGVGAAATVGGAIAQGSAASDAADTSAAQAQMNAAALAAAGERADPILSQSGRRADDLLSASGARADDLLSDAYAGARSDMAPYDSLGLQGSNALSRYLGMVPQYGVARPTQSQFVRPQTAAQIKAADQFKTKTAAQIKSLEAENQRLKAEAERPGVLDSLYIPRMQANNQRIAKLRAQKPAAAPAVPDTAAYKKAMAQWTQGQAAHSQRYRGAGDFGSYFKPYGVPEPTYKKFTNTLLKADPIYQTELNENVRAWDQSAASRGSLMSGNTVAALREMTAAGIGRGRDRHVQDYGIRHDEWEGGYNRDWNQDERKYNALLGLTNMGLGVRSGLSNARMQTAGARANAGLQVGANRASTGVNVASNRANTLMQAAGSQAHYNQMGADARASGQLAQGTAYGNAFSNIGQLGMLYGMGAFGNNNSNGTYAGSPRQNMMMYGTNNR